VRGVARPWRSARALTRWCRAAAPWS
jgi:hypothetical protein